MIHVYWQDQWLDVQRLVFDRGQEAAFDAVLDRLARLFGLDVTDDRADPRPGDFWIGCHPRRGWGEADPAQIGWASLVESRAAVDVLDCIAVEAERSVKAKELRGTVLASAAG